MEYREAETAIRLLLLNSNSEIKTEAIKAAKMIGVETLENRVWKLLYDDDHKVKTTAAEVLFYYSDKSREKLHQLAYSVPGTKESSVARMVISEKNLHMN